MSARSRKNNPKLDLKLNLSPPKTHDDDSESEDDHQQEEENQTANVSSPSSCDSSCSSSTAEDQAVGYDNVDRDSSGEAPAQVTLSTTSSPMVVLGCPRCLMYVMLSEVEPRCPRCKSTVLLDLFGEDINTKRKINHIKYPNLM